jgi:hypothetical protein
MDSQLQPVWNPTKQSIYFLFFQAIADSLDEVKQGALALRSQICQVTPLTLLSQRKLALTARNTLKSVEHLKTGRVPFLGLELAMHGLKRQIHLVKQSPW